MDGNQKKMNNKSKLVLRMPLIYCRNTQKRMGLGFQSKVQEWIRKEEGEYLLSKMDRILAWNVRGANNQQKQNLIKQLIRSQSVGLVGLLETRVKAAKLGALYLNVFNGWCFTSNIAWHKGGRMIIAWNPNTFSINILKCTSQLIHLQVSNSDGKIFLVTFVYAFNDEEEERVGDRVKDKQSHLFKDCVNYCQLEDIRSSGKFFTWCNKQQGRDRIYSKIDRILANSKWSDLFPGAEAIFMNEGMFDHSPTLLTFHQLSQMGKKPFRYFRMWSSHPDYAQQVNRVWKQVVHGTLMYQIVAKLKALKPVLKQINREGFSDLQAASIQAQEVLNECQNKLTVEPLNQQVQIAEAEARNKFIQAHKKYQSFLHQKAKINWVKEGDDNTAIFHASIKA
ncbi:uncharacterized protein LOC115695256 [Cannabis sativa]|uniref:uncharacterized protein LOC115695256 n=1 Tax=Cannabis sativa TaxID=3483 RepID=UPI0011E04B59|nr:uncharacterized protein LOC115695256 [Cannabis sativa]